MSRRFYLYAAVLWFALAGCSESKKESAASSSSPSFDEVLTSRRSVRSYDATKKISEVEVRVPRRLLLFRILSEPTKSASLLLLF